MDIKQSKEGELLMVALSGRLDTNTSPELQDTLAPEIEGVKKVEIDLTELDYVSSAGLRVLLFLHKQCALKGAALSLLNCNDMTKDIFKMTGFDSFLDIK